MPFTVEDFQDLLHLLDERPEWAAELRRRLLSAELLELPEIVRQLVEAQRRTEERVEQLTDAQRRTEERLAALTLRVDQLAERIDQLVEAQRRTEQQVHSLVLEMAGLVRAVQGQQKHLDQLRGWFLEWRYRERAHAYFGRLLRRLRVHSASQVVDQFENRLSANAVKDLLDADLVVQGQVRQAPERGDVWLVVEVSATVDDGDVARAARRAGFLREAGLRALPTAAGEVVTQDAFSRATHERAVIFKDGSVVGWDEALAAWAV